MLEHLELPKGQDGAHVAASFLLQWRQEQVQSRIVPHYCFLKLLILDLGLLFMSHEGKLIVSKNGLMDGSFR